MVNISKNGVEEEAKFWKVFILFRVVISKNGVEEEANFGKSDNIANSVQLNWSLD